MVNKLKSSHPKVHKYLFTVTTLSKLLALYFFIFFPLVGFYLGAKYQQAVTLTKLYEKQTIENKQPRLIGGDKDNHGCLVGAGYSWCNVKNKCLRVWEEPCSATPSAKRL